jgi:hypoxanthine phosphoribosyltransferase
MTKIKVSWQEFEQMANELIVKIEKSGEKFDGVYGIPRGGLILAIKISHYLNLPLLMYPTKDTLVIDDISDEGKTLSSMKNRKIATLFSTPWTKIKPDWHAKLKENKDDWIIFPWENPDTESA